MIMMMMMVVVSSATVIPNYKGCLNETARKLPYCDESKTIDERVDDLISRLTLEEKINTISPQPSLGDTCGDHTAGKASRRHPAGSLIPKSHVARLVSSGTLPGARAIGRCQSTPTPPRMEYRG